MGGTAAITCLLPLLRCRGKLSSSCANAAYQGALLGTCSPCMAMWPRMACAQLSFIISEATYASPVLCNTEKMLSTSGSHGTRVPVD